MMDLGGTFSMLNGLQYLCGSAGIRWIPYFYFLHISNYCLQSNESKTEHKNNLVILFEIKFTTVTVVF